MKKTFRNITICILISVIVTGCSCATPEIRVIEPINPKEDRYLNCSQLKFAHSEAEYFYRAAQRKVENTEAYSGNPLCLFKTQFTIIKAQEAARDRIDYLNTIMYEKGCFKDETTKPTIEKDDNVKLPVTK